MSSLNTTAAASSSAAKTTRQMNRDINLQVKRNFGNRVNELNKIMEVAFRTKKQKIIVNGVTYAMRQVISMLKKEYLKTIKYLELKPVRPKAGDAPAIAKPQLQQWLRTKLARLTSIEPLLGPVLQNALTGVTTKKIVSRLISIAIDKDLIASDKQSADTARPMSPTLQSVRSIPSIHVYVDDSIRALDPSLGASATTTSRTGQPTVLLIQLLSAIGRHYNVLEDPSDDERAQTKNDMDVLEELKRRPKDGEDPEKTALDKMKRSFVMNNVKMIEVPGQNPVVTKIYRDQLGEYLITEEGQDTLQSIKTQLAKLKPSKSVPQEKIDRNRAAVAFLESLASETDALKGGARTRRSAQPAAASSANAAARAGASPTRARSPMRPVAAAPAAPPAAVPPPAPAPAPAPAAAEPTVTSAVRRTGVRSAAAKK